MANQYDKDKDMNSQQRGNANPGNFKNDPEKAREAGKKGGESSHTGGRSSNS